MADVLWLLLQEIMGREAKINRDKTKIQTITERYLGQVLLMTACDVLDAVDTLTNLGSETVPSG